ncbi:MAG TPA: hypothetical protein VKZ63_12185 [Kofleriaceae bacterium]|nr:hypothetical protein [Kofleriaceae bacterium]
MVAMAGGVAALVTAAGSPALAQDRDQARHARPFTPAWAAPQLRASPGGGWPGSRVVITGARFGDRVRAFYGHWPMRILRRDDRHLIVEIPRRAWGDRHIYVIDSTGRARTVRRFALSRGGPGDRYGAPYEHDPYPYPYDPYPYEGPPPDPYAPYDGRDDDWYHERHHGDPVPPHPDYDDPDDWYERSYGGDLQGRWH